MLFFICGCDYHLFPRVRQLTITQVGDMETAGLKNKVESKTEKFEAVALAHTELLYKFALCMAENESDAQDLVQDTYLRAFRFFDKFKDGTNCRAWLLAILKNTFINTVRRDKRRPQMLLMSDMEKQGIELSNGINPEDKIFRELIEDDISIAIDTLPVIYRKVVHLADIEGFSYREIANLVGCPIGTVMSRLSRGRDLLRRKLQTYADQYGLG